MKKFVAIIAVVLMAFVVVACGNDAETSATEIEMPAATEIAPIPTIEPEETSEPIAEETEEKNIFIAVPTEAPNIGEAVRCDGVPVDEADMSRTDITYDISNDGYVCVKSHAEWSAPATEEDTP